MAGNCKEIRHLGRLEALGGTASGWKSPRGGWSCAVPKLVGQAGPPPAIWVAKAYRGAAHMKMA